MARWGLYRISLPPGKDETPSFLQSLQNDAIKLKKKKKTLVKTLALNVAFSLLTAQCTALLMPKKHRMSLARKGPFSYTVVFFLLIPRSPS